MKHLTLRPSAFIEHRDCGGPIPPLFIVVRNIIFFAQRKQQEKPSTAKDDLKDEHYGYLLSEAGRSDEKVDPD